MFIGRRTSYGWPSILRRPPGPARDNSRVRPPWAEILTWDDKTNSLLSESRIKFAVQAHVGKISLAGQFLLLWRPVEDAGLPVASLANTHHVGDTLRLSLCIFQKRLRISYFLQPLEPAGLFLLSEARKIWWPPRWLFKKIIRIYCRFKQNPNS